MRQTAPPFARPAQRLRTTLQLAGGEGMEDHPLEYSEHEPEHDWQGDGQGDGQEWQHRHGKRNCEAGHTKYRRATSQYRWAPLWQKATAFYLLSWFEHIPTNHARGPGRLLVGYRKPRRTSCGGALWEGTARSRPPR